MMNLITLNVEQLMLVVMLGSLFVMTNVHSGTIKH